MPLWTWENVTPNSIEAEQEHLVYDIKDWLCLSANKLSTDSTVPDEVRANIVKLVRPLQSLYFNSTSHKWDYTENCKCCLASSLETIFNTTSIENHKSHKYK